MIKISQNIDFKTLMIAVLIVIILILQTCGGDKKNTKKTDTIKVNGKKYEIVDHKSDTTFITKDSIVYKKGEEIKVEVKVPVYIPTEVDTELILKDYFSKRFYIDTLELDSKSFVIIKDSISENKIMARIFESSITERIIKDTLFLKEPIKRQLFFGFQMGFDKKDIINYGGLSLIFKDKREKLYGLGLGLSSNGQPAIMGNINWKIKLKK